MKARQLFLFCFVLFHLSFFFVTCPVSGDCPFFAFHGYRCWISTGLKLICILKVTPGIPWETQIKRKNENGGRKLRNLFRFHFIFSCPRITQKKIFLEYPENLGNPEISQSILHLGYS